MKHPYVTVLLSVALAGCSHYRQSDEIPITQASMSPVIMATATTAPATTIAGAHESQAQEPPDPAPTSRPEMVAASVLQINSTFLTVDDILRQKRVELHDLPAGLGQQTFRQRASTIVQDGIRELVQQALIYNTAFDRLGDEQKEQIDNEVKQAQQDMLTKAGGSKAKLQQELAKEDITLEKALEDHKKHLVIEMYLRWKFQPSIYVSRKMMWEHYQAHKDEFTSPAMVQMQMIIVDPRRMLPSAVGEASDQELAKARLQARKQIDIAAGELKKGASFSDVAGKYANDPRTLARKQTTTDKSDQEFGLWPLMQQGSHMLSKVEAVAFGMKAGQVSGIIEDSGCFVIVKTCKVQAGGVTSFEDSQARIEETLRRAQYKKMQDEYYDKLTKSAVIVKSPDLLNRCLDRAADKYWKK